MLSESVAQKPTLAVSAGKKNAQNFPALGPVGSNCDGWFRIGPNPLAFWCAHHKSKSPSPIRSGALMLSRMRIESMPQKITTTLIAQKAMKQANWAELIPAKPVGSASHSG